MSVPYDTERAETEMRPEVKSPIDCHCGRPIHIYEDMGGFTRGMCCECSTVRCDTWDGGPSPPDDDDNESEKS